MRIVLTAVLLFCTAYAQAECRLSLPRAGFADVVQDREPVGDGSGNSERLWFFTEVANGAGEVLYHQWYRNGEEDARVRLQIGADRWRTWSSRGRQSDARYTVRVLTESGCDLGEYGVISANDSGISAASSALLTEARALLASADITGARLLVRKAQQSGASDPALTRFLEQDLALAELARDIREDNLYIAGGRIDTLQQLSMSAANQALLESLQQQWQQRREQLRQEMSSWLMAVQRSLANMPASADCEATVDNSSWLPEPHRDQLSITGQQHQSGMQTLQLLDQRSGLQHQLERPCL
ncbi:MAG: DUF2914 domain-containing protein [Alcanivoracaceae bacterium]|nr:DUF2914 domain-containing protein [Alcanivoracaceae bacterium]